MATISDTIEFWSPEVTYVIGHQRPDTDTIASALGYAWFLGATGTANVLAARTGQVGPQATFMLNRFHTRPPQLLTFAAPTFQHAARPQETVTPETALSDAMTRLATGARVVPVVDPDNKPLGGLTPLALARAYAKSTNGKNAFDRPCGEFVESLPQLRARDRISDYRNALLRGDGDDFLVVSDQGTYIGVATQRRILEPPRAKLVLVDHNELSQAVAGADEADIVAVLDHHRLDNPSTASPIPFIVEPVGSTCTLVAELCERNGKEPSQSLAGVLLSGLLSDTLVLRSPTTTRRDHHVAQWLSKLAGVDIKEYGSELLNSSPGLAARDAEEILDADRKNYQLGIGEITIAQVEVTNLEELAYRRNELLIALETCRERESLVLACLMVTDVVVGQSHLLVRGAEPLLNQLPFPRRGEFEFDLEEVVSRKKQLLPALTSVLEQI